MECQHCSTCSWALIGHTMLHNISNHIKEVLCVLSETGINPFWSRGLMRICNYRRQASSLMFFVCVSYLRDFRLFTLDSGQYWKLVMVSPGSACNIPQLTDAQCQSNVFNISNKCIFKFEMECGNNKWRYRAPHKQNTNNHQPHLNFQCVCVWELEYHVVAFVHLSNASNCHWISYVINIATHMTHLKELWALYP